MSMHQRGLHDDLFEVKQTMSLVLDSTFDNTFDAEARMERAPKDQDQTFSDHLWVVEDHQQGG